MHAQPNDDDAEPFEKLRHSVHGNSSPQSTNKGRLKRLQKAQRNLGKRKRGRGRAK